MLVGLRLAIAGLREEMGLPRAKSRGHQLKATIIKHLLPRAFAAGEDARDIVTVERTILRRFNARQRAKCRQDVERAGQLLRDASRRPLAGPPGCRWPTPSAVPGRSL